MRWYTTTELVLLAIIIVLILILFGVLYGLYKWIKPYVEKIDNYTKSFDEFVDNIKKIAAEKKSDLTDRSNIGDGRILG